LSGRSDGTSDRSWATLAETIKGIRAELSEAMSASEGERLRFDVGPVEMEFAVEVQRDAEAHAGVKVWVVEIGGSGGWSRDSSHRIKVTLNPIDTATGRSARVSEQMPKRPQRRSSG
jgi:Trypsin-co-occurring domain 2